MSKILVIGANPAWQKVLFFKEVIPGGVNRAYDKLAFASGKGINFCRAARCHAKADTHLLQFTGGDVGQMLENHIEREHLVADSFALTGSTRCCTSCIDISRSNVTELIEPSAPASRSAVEMMLEIVRKALPEMKMLAICGTLPADTPVALYVEAARLAGEAGVPLLIDSYQHIQEVLAVGRDMILKINREEAAELTGENDPAAALRKLFAAWQLRYGAITAGGDDAWMSDGKRLFRYHLPPLPRMVNSIGCGDTASAIFASELVAGTAPETAFAAAMGGAMANCETPICGQFLPDEAARLTADITMTQQTLL